MPSFPDRSDELSILAQAFSAARSAGTPALVTIEGTCGIGKTWLLERFLQAIGEDARATSTRAQRLERFTPGSLASVLHEPADVIAIDDAQWCDRRSAELLDARLTSRESPVFVLLAFDDGAPPLRTAIAQRVILWSGSDVETPYDVVKDAQLHDDGPPARAIARFIGALPTFARTVAQMLALIAAPVDAAFARALWSDERELNAALDRLSPLVRREDGCIAYDHLLTAASVVETIPMKVPLHRRIIAALERLGRGGLGERVLVLEQLLGSGDRALAQQAALELAFAALHAGAPDAQLWASARHVELDEPPDERFVAFYTQYFTALMERGEYERAEGIASHALSAAQQRSIRGVATLAAQLIEAQWMVNRHDAARASYERYAQAFTDPVERAQLDAAAAWLRAG